MFCLDSWNTGTQSHSRDSGSFFIKVYSGASPEVFQAISPTDSPLTWFQFYFPCHLFRFASVPLPVVIRWLCFTPHMSSCEYERATFIGGNESVQSNSPTSFWLWEKWSLSLCLSHMYTIHTHTQKNGPYRAVLLLPKAMVMHFHFILNFFVCSPWPSMIHDHQKRENTQWEQIKWY